MSCSQKYIMPSSAYNNAVRICLCIVFMERSLWPIQILELKFKGFLMGLCETEMIGIPLADLSNLFLNSSA